MKRLARRIPETVRRQIDAHRALNRALDAALPASARGHVRVAALEHDRLVLEADSPVWATKTRYLETGIIRQLRDDTGLSVKSLRLRVKPATETPGRRKRQPPTLSADSARHLTALADDVSHPGLQKALSRLAKRASGRRSGDR